MKQASLKRYQADENQVKGFIISHGLKLDTLEKFATLINPGKYVCKYTRSTRLSLLALTNWLKKNPTLSVKEAPERVKNYFTYEITEVPGRSGLRIHSANLSKVLAGCVAPGYGFSDINKDGVVDIINSNDAITDLEDYFEKQDFELIVE